jgi:hypothetical protein
MVFPRVSYKSGRWLIPSLFLLFAGGVSSGGVCEGSVARGADDARERTGLAMSKISSSSASDSVSRLRLRLRAGGGDSGALPLATTLAGMRERLGLAGVGGGGRAVDVEDLSRELQILGADLGAIILARDGRATEEVAVGR